jgi:hypothetical protein
LKYICKLAVSLLTYFIITSLLFSKKSYKEHDKWISKPYKEQCRDYNKMYGEAHMKYSPEETSAELRKKVNMVPWDIMR